MYSVSLRYNSSWVVVLWAMALPPLLVSGVSLPGNRGPGAALIASVLFDNQIVMPQTFFFENRPKLSVKTLETALSKMGEDVEDRPTPIDPVPSIDPV